MQYKHCCKLEKLCQTLSTQFLEDRKVLFLKKFHKSRLAVRHWLPGFSISP